MNNLVAVELGIELVAAAWLIVDLLIVDLTTVSLMSVSLMSWHRLYFEIGH